MLVMMMKAVKYLLCETMCQVLCCVNSLNTLAKTTQLPSKFCINDPELVLLTNTLCMGAVLEKPIIHSFIHSFYQYLQGTLYVVGIVLRPSSLSCFPFLASESRGHNGEWRQEKVVLPVFRVIGVYHRS